MLVLVLQPSAFLRELSDDHANPDCRIKIQHGTTTLAFRFQGGIIVAVDSRATAGSYVGALSLCTERRLRLTVGSQHLERSKR